ncbi:MAG: HAD family hydrolase [Chloroflexota bacterium]
MQKNIHAILFDFGGVLLEWDPRRLYRRYFEQPQEVDHFLAEINFPAWNLEQDRGRPFAQAVAELSAQFPQHARLIRAYHEQWEESIVGPIPGTARILQQLKQAGFLLYGLSNWSHETFPLVHKKYPFFDLFDDIILSGAVELVKPDPRIFQLTLDRIGRNANECLLVDDSPANIASARDLGLATVQFHSSRQLERDLHLLGLLQEAYP